MQESITQFKTSLPRFSLESLYNPELVLIPHYKTTPTKERMKGIVGKVAEKR